MEKENYYSFYNDFVDGKFAIKIESGVSLNSLFRFLREVNPTKTEELDKIREEINRTLWEPCTLVFIKGKLTVHYLRKEWLDRMDIKFFTKERYLKLMEQLNDERAKTTCNLKNEPIIKSRETTLELFKNSVNEREENKMENKIQNLLITFQKIMNKQIEAECEEGIKKLEEEDKYTILAKSIAEVVKKEIENFNNKLDPNEEKIFEVEVSGTKGRLTAETLEKIKKVKELENTTKSKLADYLKIVDVRAKLCEDYSQVIEVLKIYKILNKNGALNENFSSIEEDL